MNEAHLAIAISLSVLFGFLALCGVACCKSEMSTRDGLIAFALIAASTLVPFALMFVAFSHH
ncbi:hypothetical protein PQR39_35465 [Paraburkholderia sediminicola]|uniref:hypothetical protein n=1 Tax=Paraburkholderia sediminicola TaxID=458836 RepID=UPI0038BCEE70